MSSNNRSRRWNKNKKNANRGNKNKKGDNSRPARQAKPRPSIALKPLVREAADCPICGDPIKDITSALSLRGEGVPAHFDCVLSQIKEKENLAEGEVIIYLGKGDFGVVNDEEYRKGKLSIIRKVAYEQLENREEWRMKMRQDVDFQRK